MYILYMRVWNMQIGDMGWDKDSRTVKWVIGNRTAFTEKNFNKHNYLIRLISPWSPARRSPAASRCLGRAGHCWGWSRPPWTVPSAWGRPGRRGGPGSRSRTSPCSGHRSPDTCTSIYISTHPLCLSSVKHRYLFYAPGVWDFSSPASRHHHHHQTRYHH